MRHQSMNRGKSERGSWRIVRACLPALLLSASVRAQAPPAAQPAAPSERIVGIRVVGFQTVSPDTIAHYLGVKVGDPYDPERIRSNFQSLWDVGLLENISVEAERDAGGVTLVVTLEERPTISSVDFTGNKKLSTSQIRDRLREEKVEIRQGAPLALRDIAKTRSAIADLYIEQGYR
ncbi:MAG: POTRA domain-containing protein, partial [Thermoanaerobaculia bacterium]